MENSIIKIKNLFKQDLKTQNSFVIAEIGNNHNGDFLRATKMIDLAIKMGACYTCTCLKRPWLDRLSSI